jgi:hypothetical protein
MFFSVFSPKPNRGAILWAWAAASSSSRVLNPAGGEILFDFMGDAFAHPGNALESLEAAGFIEDFHVVF